MEAVAGPSRLSNERPQSDTDFQQVLARFRLPFAPVFLTRPTLKVARHRVDNDDDDDDDDSSSSEEEDQAEPHPTDGASGAVEAANQMLATYLMRYLPSVEGVVLAFSAPHRFLSSSTLAPHPSTDFSTTPPSANIPDTVNPTPAFLLPGWTPSAFANLHFETSLLIWRPEIMSRLTGYATPTGSSASHLSLLIHGTFNASIPKEELVSPERDGKGKGKKRWRWDGDRQVPEGWKKTFFDNGTSTNADDEAALEEDVDERGCWINERGEVLCGDDGRVEFTVIRLTVADHILTVTGSLLSPKAIAKRLRSRPSAPESAYAASEGSEKDRQLDDDLHAPEEEADPPPAKPKKSRKERSDKGKPRGSHKKKALDASDDQPGLGDEPDLRMPPPLVLPDIAMPQLDTETGKKRGKKKRGLADGEPNVEEAKRKKKVR